jgi:hypothetical protein
VGELSLRKDTKMDTDEQRRQNRRVDIVVTNFEPKNASEALSYLSRRNTQQFQAPALDRPCTFTGKKGTRLSIPANAFALKNADKSNPQPVPPIQIEMREAYTFGDMILQNLSTVSDSQLIQTGGMIYLEAKDALGRGLELAQNKNVSWELPNHNPLPEGMQLFTATRQGADNQAAINWNATGQPFIATPFEDHHWIEYLSNPTSIWNTEVGTFYKPKDFAPTEIPVIADQKIIQLPKVPKKCEKPVLNLLKTPELADFKKQHSKKKLESAADYNQRVETLYNNRLQQIEKRNATLQNEYEIALNDYTAYTQALSQYNLALLEKKQADSTYEAQIENLEPVLKSVWYKIDYHLFTLPSFLIKNTEEFAKHYRLENFQAELNDLHAEAVKVEAKSKIVKALKNYDNTYLKIYDSEFSGFIHRFRNTFPHVKEHENTTLGRHKFSPKAAANWSFEQPNGEVEHGLGAYSATCNKIFGDAAFWAFYKQTAIAYHEFAAQDPSEIVQLLQKLELIRKRIYQQPEIKAALARAVKKAKMEKMMQNVAQLNGLGWANCDRFATYPDLMHFTINAKSDTDAQYFLVMPTEKVVVNLSSNETQVFSPRAYQGLPASKNAKLIGIRMTAQGKPEVCVHQSLVSELSKAQLVFKPAALEDLPKILAKI